MIRRAHLFRIALVSALAVLAVTASTATAGVRLNGVDFGAYPAVGATVLTSVPSTVAPAIP